jgi:hypothetical protein
MLMREACNDARRLVYGSMNEQINLLEEDYPADGERLVMRLDAAGITPGMIVSSGLNVWYVTEVTAASKTVYVIPGYDGSRQAAMPAGSVVMIRPRVTDWQLFTEVNRAILSMSSRTKGLYRLGSETVSNRVGAWGMFQLGAFDVESIVAITVNAPWGEGTTHQLQDRAWRWNSKDRTLRILDPAYSWMTTARVTFRAPFRPAFDLDSDLSAVCGLTSSMEDIPALGAAASLLLTTEGRRAQVAVQGDPRRASETPPGSNSSAAREMRRRFDQRVDDEYVRLLNANPIMRSI